MSQNFLKIRIGKSSKTRWNVFNFEKYNCFLILEILVNLMNPVSISTGVQFYRVRHQRARDLLNCDGEGWFSSVYSIAGMVCRDKITRFVSDPKNLSNLVGVIYIRFFFSMRSNA